MVTRTCVPFFSPQKFRSNVQCIDKLPAFTDPKSRCVEIRQAPLPEGLLVELWNGHTASFERYLMEIDAKAVCKLVNAGQLSCLSVFRTGKSDSGPGCIDMQPY